MDPIGPGEHATLERPSPRRLLFVTSRLPWPPSEGHQLRSWHLLRAAASRHHVHLLSLLRPEDPRELAPEARRLVADFEGVPLAGDFATDARAFATSLLGGEPFVARRYATCALRDRFARCVQSCDFVHLDMLPLAALAPLAGARPVVLNEHNVEHVLAHARAGLAGSLPRRLALASQVAPLRRFERIACENATRVLACSDVDAAQLRELAPRAVVRVIPNGVDLGALRPLPPPSPETAVLAFVGGLGWFPNRDGVAWFCADVLPRVLARRPDARFHLIGRAEGFEPPAGVAHAVVLRGFVPSLADALAQASACVVPLRAGSGTRLKVLEAMALGRAMVSTRIGSEGIALDDGRDVLLADDADAFADACVRLLDDAALRERLASAARTLADARYGWDAIGRELLGVYDEALGAVAARSGAAPAATSV